MWKRLGRSPFVQSSLAILALGYLWLVRRTTRFVVEPSGFPQAMAGRAPVIVAMWHGQHFIVHFAWPPGARVSALISRHGDAAINAEVLRRLGVKPIRGSGGGSDKMRKRGGMLALREMLRDLTEGSNVVLTADVPKVSRIAGGGIVTLAQLSGCPVYPIAVVSSRRIDFRSWDRASLPMPFGRGAMVLGDPVHVPRDADAAAIEQARAAVESGLNAAHARAWALAATAPPEGWRQ